MDWLLQSTGPGAAEAAALSAQSMLAAKNNVKMVIVVRQDLGMGAGKVAAQCCHGAVDLYRTLSRQADPPSTVLEQWELNGETKVVVGCKNEEALIKLATAAEAVPDVTCSIIQDAGRTEVAAGSRTVAVSARTLSMCIPFIVSSRSFYL